MPTALPLAPARDALPSAGLASPSLDGAVADLAPVAVAAAA